MFLVSLERYHWVTQAYEAIELAPRKGHTKFSLKSGYDIQDRIYNSKSEPHPEILFPPLEARKPSKITPRDATLQKNEKENPQSVSQRYGASLRCCRAQTSVLICCGAIFRPLQHFALCRSVPGHLGTQRRDARVCSIEALGYTAQGARNVSSKWYAFLNTQRTIELDKKVCIPPQMQSHLVILCRNQEPQETYLMPHLLCVICLYFINLIDATFSYVAAVLSVITILCFSSVTSVYKHVSAIMKGMSDGRQVIIEEKKKENEREEEEEKQKPMPRSRGSEMPQQRHSPRAPLHLKTTACSEANSIRSPKLEDRRSPRSPLQERKKVSSRVADLETKLGQAHEEIEKLKEKLASTEAAKLDLQKELEEKKKHFPVSPLKNAALDLVDEEKEKTINMEEEKVEPAKVLVMDKDEPLPAKEDCVKCLATDVFEVAPATNEAEGRKVEAEDAEEGTETKVIIEEEKSEEEMGTLAKEKQQEEEVESPEITELREILAEKDKQLESIVIESQTFIKEAKNAKADSSEWRAKADEMATKLAQAEEELNKTKLTTEHLREKLESEETAKASVEAEMKRLRVQTEQWRKAAEAAASVLVAGDALVNDGELNGRRLGESGRSMEKNLRGYDVSVGGGGWSPVIAGGEGAEGNGGGKRRGGGGGIRVFGELWKKKGQLK
ncbi:hypothetical protein IEQ34_003639 [Dendrobium chrysotoxum]|uniref:Interactor of constitutive active ROPs 4 n=1 Tax=Dendrobium chrysotoxum TaxID=161865 RepID=A0AAV7HCS1_DENCH|nr:hypothetical protein IEQ34_003639 [Dendrobium chrysotoxum]